MSYLHKNFSLIDPNKYYLLIGKKIKIMLNKKILNKTELIGKCLTTPPLFIIYDIYRDTFPTISISIKNDEYIAYISLTNIKNIYKICNDITSKVYSVLVCKHHNIPSDISKYIISFMQGWTIDVPLY